MFKNLLGYWYLKKKISNGFLGEGLVSIKSKKINNFCYEEKTLIHKKGNDSAISGYQKFDIVENKNFKDLKLNLSQYCKEYNYRFYDERCLAINNSGDIFRIKNVFFLTFFCKIFLF